MESSGDKPVTSKPQSPPDEDYETLKYQLLGPSLTKAGQDSVDQQKVGLVMLSCSKMYWESIAYLHF
jgi:DNA polymerase kappa